MASTVSNILLIGWSSPFPVILFGTMYCRVLYHCFPGRSRCHSVLHKPLRTKKMFNWCLIEIIWRFPKMGVAISYYSSYIMGVAISYIFLLLVLSLRFFSLQNLTDDTVPGRNAWCKGRLPWYHDPSKRSWGNGVENGSVHHAKWIKMVESWNVCEKYHL